APYFISICPGGSMFLPVNRGGSSDTPSLRTTADRQSSGQDLAKVAQTDDAGGWHPNNNGWDTADGASVFNAVLRPGGEARFIPVQAQPLPQEPPEGGAPKFGSAAPKTNPGAGGQSAKVIPFPNSQAPKLTPQEVPRSVPDGLQRLGVLLGLAEAGWE